MFAVCVAHVPGCRHMSVYDWLQLLLHVCMLSLLAVGGALSIVPDMHRYLVNEHRLLSETAFSQSVTLAQIAPGPNILLIAVIGWNLSLQQTREMQNGFVSALCALLLATALLVCAVLPSSLLAYTVSHAGCTGTERPGACGSLKAACCRWSWV